MKLSEAGLLKNRDRRWQGSFDAFDPMVLELEEQRRLDDRRERQLGLTLALAFHLIIMLMVFPSFDNDEADAPEHRVRVYQMQQVKLQPPRPRVEQAVQKRAIRTIPIPDPTPHDPEPIFEEDDLEMEEVDLVLVAGLSDMPLPDAPPGPAFNALRLDGDIDAPIKISAPAPKYSEEARRARVRGVVILETIIDTLGKVVDVKVLKGLPSGLTEAAVDAVSSWSFQPAMLDGEPVSVYYMVTVTFDLQ